MLEHYMSRLEHSLNIMLEGMILRASSLSIMPLFKDGIYLEPYYLGIVILCHSYRPLNSMV